ncbi:MAG: hypothetical protein N2258_03160 [Brevinematales bacterium]|nr:hypothetical protein [Brevinematales bacterium]
MLKFILQFVQSLVCRLMSCFKLATTAIVIPIQYRNSFSNFEIGKFYRLT